MKVLPTQMDGSAERACFVLGVSWHYADTFSPPNHAARSIAADHKLLNAWSVEDGVRNLLCLSTIKRNISFMVVRPEKLKIAPHRHHCPWCGSRTLSRVRRKGFIDWVLTRIFGLRPYECDDCGRKCHLRPRANESKSAC